MFDGFFKALPASMKRKMIKNLSGILKKLVRESHAGEELEIGEEDFAVLLFLADKTDDDSALMALVYAVDQRARPVRQVKVYNLDHLTDKLNDHV